MIESGCGELEVAEMQGGQYHWAGRSLAVSFLTGERMMSYFVDRVESC